MAQFSYKGVDQVGNAVSGTLEAPDRGTAISQLTRLGHFPTEINLGASGAVVSESISGESLTVKVRGGSIRRKDILAITAQLTTALQAGLPLLDSLHIIRDQQSRQTCRDMMNELAESVRAGDSFSDALQKYPQHFGPLYVSMVQVGETGGILEETMTQLTRLLAREHKVRSKMLSASLYPMILLGLGILSTIAFIIFIVPKIIDSIGVEISAMPLPTRMLVGLGDMMKLFGIPVLIALIVGWFFFRRWLRTPRGRLLYDSFMLKVPVVASVLRTIAVGRFTRTLGALTKSGIPILDALAVVRGTLGNERLAREVDQVAAKVKTGEPVAEPLSSSGMFPPLLVQIVSLGEQTGRLDEMLLNAAETFEEAADTTIDRFMSLFPVVLVLLLAGVMAFIILATLLPLLTMELM